MANKIISRKLREAREAAGFTQREVYEWLGIGQSTFSGWETGLGAPSIETFLRLCRKYNIKDISGFFLPEAMGGTSSLCLDPVFINKMLSLSKRGRDAVRSCLEFEYNNRFAEAAAPIRHKRLIPLFTQAATAGTGNYLDDRNAEMVELDAPENADFAVNISGDSMEPLIRNGSTVFVRSQSTLYHGEIGLFSYNGESYCKMWDNKGGAPKLVSINSEKYPPIILKKSDRLITYGKVLI